jgi:hypothetical protein
MLPWLFFAFTSVPFSMRSRATSSRPLLHAQISGVSPWLVLASTSTPFSMRERAYAAFAPSQALRSCKESCSRSFSPHCATSCFLHHAHHLPSGVCWKLHVLLNKNLSAYGVNKHATYLRVILIIVTNFICYLYFILCLIWCMSLFITGHFWKHWVLLCITE